MKTKIEIESGQIFECVKNNRQHSAVKGKFYLYDGGQLKTYTTRNVTVLLKTITAWSFPVHCWGRYPAFSTLKPR